MDRVAFAENGAIVYYLNTRTNCVIIDLNQGRIDPYLTVLS
jgi:hypothetical protein